MFFFCVADVPSYDGVSHKNAGDKNVKLHYTKYYTKHRRNNNRSGEAISSCAIQLQETIVGG